MNRKPAPPAQIAAADDLMKQGMAALNSGQLLPAERAFGKVLRKHPNHFAAANLHAIALMQLGRFGDAENSLKRAIAISPTVDATFSNYGFVLRELKRPAEALVQLEQALRINPSNPLTWCNHGSALNDLRRFDDAVVSFDKAIALQRGFAEAICNKGNALSQLKRYPEASDAYDRALELNKNLPDAWLGLGHILALAKRNIEALAAYEKALSLSPQLTSAWSGRGSAYAALLRRDEALAAYERALSIQPDLAEAWNGKGNVLRDMLKHRDAIMAYDRALALQPDLAESYLGRGNALSDIQNFDAAVADYEQAVALDPDLAEAWAGLSFARLQLKKHLEAYDAIDRAFAINPGLRNVKGARLHLKMQMCNWDHFDEDCADLIRAIRSGKAATAPFALLGLPSTPEDQLSCAKIWMEETYPSGADPVWQGEVYKHDRIRICYVCSDFYKHAMSYIVAGLFEAHDSSRFEISAISSGPDDGSEIRDRIKKSFSQFIDARDMSDMEVAEWIKKAEIDILVDLNGLTGGTKTRTGVFARRCAPIQVNYLSYAGTMGTKLIDYIIADHTLINGDDTRFYAEKVAFMPHSYQANDDKRECSDKVFTREECGLPQQGFVFCCFNNSWKILPETFDLWMSILRDVDASVLWLVADNPVGAANLKKEAAARGIDPDRLIFADRTSIGLYRARLRLADLFLDTLPYNAHSTASDALWMALPVLTRAGETFASRVAASLLNAVGVPELVTHSREEYRLRALDLASQPGKLAEIKDRLQKNRQECPLFNTAQYARHLEGAYVAMYERWQAGALPDHIDVQD